MKKSLFEIIVVYKIVNIFRKKKKKKKISAVTHPSNQEQQVTSVKSYTSSTECSPTEIADTGPSQDLVRRLRGDGGSKDHESPVRRTRSTTARSKMMEMTGTNSRLGTPSTPNTQTGLSLSQAKFNTPVVRLRVHFGFCYF